MTNKRRNLNILYAIEVLNGRLNTSAEQVEKRGSFDNISFTKKVDGKGYTSAVSIKKNMKNYMANQGFEVSELIKKGNQPIAPCNPVKFVNEDLFGFMRAESEVIAEEEYLELDDNIKKLYKKKKKEYERNITKKRQARFMLNGLIGVSFGKVQKEFGTVHIKGDNSSLYTTETYSDIMCGLGNLDVANTSKFNISGIESEFRDYSVEEGEALEIEEELNKEDKLRRINVALDSLQYLEMASNQSNYLVDTKPKIVILREYSWGNNAFQGLINKSGINIEGIKEVIEDFDKFRASKIWIGISNNIMSDSFKADRDEIAEQLSDYSDIVEVCSVGQAFDKYKEFLKETL